MNAREVAVGTDPAYRVRVGAGLLGALAAELSGCSRVAVIADARVAALHGARLAGLEDAAWLELPSGEEAKSLAQLGRALEHLAAAGLDRRSAVVTLGGGATSDVGGLAASLFKRGIDVVHAPTTLLAQVDAAVGGKTAIDLAAGKNLAGTFHQPRAVFADVELLATLPERELRSGLGEVLKSALLAGEALLSALERDAEALLAREPQALARTVVGCVELKARIVAADPRERGGRRALNLGHTFGHAIEHAAGYGRVPHGLAVAAGIGLALEASRRAGVLADESLPGRAARLARRLGLPAGLDELRAEAGLDLPPGALLAGMAQDKKGAVGRPELVLLRAAGEPVAGIALAREVVRELLEPAPPEAARPA